GPRIVPLGGPVRDAWDPGALDGLRAGRPVVIMGTGLTAVDVILSLDAAGFDGPIHAVSRHGLLPQAHRPGALPSVGGEGQGVEVARVTPLRSGPPATAWTARSLVAALR